VFGLLWLARSLLVARASPISKLYVMASRLLSSANTFLWIHIGVDGFVGGIGRVGLRG
jgi:hypothetical protein